MDLDARVTTAAGVTFVAVRLRNPHPVAQRVRLANRLDGPVLPPRTEGVPEAGWDETGVTAVVPADGTRALGYACPAPPTESPVVLAERERWDGPDPPDRPRMATRTLGDGVDPTSDRADETAPPAASADPTAPADQTALADPTDPAALVRRLGRSAPPRDAVPPPDRGATRVESDGAAVEADATAVGDDVETSEDATTTGSAAVTEGDDPVPTGETVDASDSRPPVPPAVARWLAGVERRIRAADRLGPETSVAEATDRLAPLDVPPGELPDRLAADARTLERVATTCRRLADRADGATMPTDGLRRLS
jgi:hypothetical protein